MANRGTGFGYVYVMSHYSKDGYKVGYTMCKPAKRAKEIQKDLKLESELKVEYYIEVTNPYEIERLAHNSFLSKRYGKTEWFDCSKSEAIWAIQKSIEIKSNKIPNFYQGDEFWLCEIEKRFFYDYEKPRQEKQYQSELLEKSRLQEQQREKMEKSIAQRKKETTQNENEGCLLIIAVIIAILFLMN